MCNTLFDSNKHLGAELDHFEIKLSDNVELIQTEVRIYKDILIITAFEKGAKAKDRKGHEYDTISIPHLFIYKSYD